MKNTKKMRFGDYYYLAKQSVKSRKKSTRTTVRGISFGLILIVPVIFFALSFYLDFNGKINEQKPVAQFTYYSANINYDGAINSNYGGYVFDYKTIVDMPQELTPSEAIYFERYQIDRDLEYKINGGSFKTREKFNPSYDPNNTSGKIKPGDNYLISALHYDLSGGKFITDAQNNTYKATTKRESIFLEGTGFTASTKGQGEIIISQELATLFDAHNGDTFSLRWNQQQGGGNGLYLDNDTNPNNKYDELNNNPPPPKELPIILDSFKVVGVVDSAYYKLLGQNSDAGIFLTDASLYDNGELLKPVTTLHKGKTDNDMDKIIATYTTSIDDLCQRAKRDNKFVTAYCYGVSPTIGYNNNLLTTVSDGGMLIRAQYKDYAHADSVQKYVKNYLKANKIDYFPPYTNEVFESMQTINVIATVLTVTLSIFGGVILFATLLNLYNSIQYSVEARRNYMGMLRAIGAKNKSIYSMYSMEMFIIFGRALAYTTVIGGGISIAIKFIFDMVFKRLAGMFPIALTLNLLYLPIVILAVFAFTAFIGFIYSRISCRPLVKKPILSVLKEDR